MSSNDKAFGVKDLQPNKSHLVPGKTGDGQNSDPLTTAMHPRDEIDALIALGKEARGEKLTAIGVVTRNEYSKPSSTVTPVSNVIRTEHTVVKYVQEGLEELSNYELTENLKDLEKQVEELKDRLVKAFKHQGFNFDA